MSESHRVLHSGRGLGASIALQKPLGATELVAAVRWTLREQASA